MTTELTLITTIIELLAVIALIWILTVNARELNEAKGYIEYLNFRVDELRNEHWKLRQKTKDYCEEGCEACRGKGD